MNPKIKEVGLYDGQGFVNFVDGMGSDSRILKSARQSTGGAEQTTDARDRGLIRYLFRNKHTSPVEQVVLTFETKIPIFIGRQFLRHRALSANEFSGRYSAMDRDYYTPEYFYGQGDKNHQKADDEVHHLSDNAMAMMINNIEDSYDLYESLIESGIAREQARMNLPLNTFTRIIFTINLHNLFHLLMLREHEHAQKEIIEMANGIHTILNSIDELKWIMEIFNDLQPIHWKYQKVINELDRKGNLDILSKALDNILEGDI